MPDTKNYKVKELENDLDKVPKKNIVGYRRKVVQGKDGSRNLINLAIVKDPETGSTKTIATSHWKSKKVNRLDENTRIRRSILSFVESTQGPGYMSARYSSHQPARGTSQGRSTFGQMLKSTRTPNRNLVRGSAKPSISRGVRNVSNFLTRGPQHPQRHSQRHPHLGTSLASRNTGVAGI